MPTEVIMPKVDMDMSHGKIAVWHAAEGEKVEKSAPLFDIETDKAAMEVESPAAGYLHHTAPAGSDVAIGHAVAWIYAEGEAVEDPPGGKTPEASPAGDAPAPNGHASALAAPDAAQAEPSAPPANGVRATPAARRLAGLKGIDIAAVDGTGPRGRVQKRDVEAAEAHRAKAPEPEAPHHSASTRRAPLPARNVDAAAQPIVLVHGFAADAAGWAPLERRLGKGASVSRIELPGHGRTAAAKIAGFADLLAYVRERFDALELADAHLVGHSLGGALAIALADQRPDAVAALTLIAPAGLGAEIDGAVLAGIARASRAESLAPWLKRLVANDDLISWNYVQAAALARSDPALREAQQQMVDALFPDGVQSFDVRDALRRLDCKTRIIWGRRDAIIPWRHALEAPGRVSLNLFEDVGHLPHVEAPEAIAALMMT